MNSHIANYIRRHWRGECSLAWAFWVNFLLLFVVLNFLERFTLPPYLRGEWSVTFAVVGFFLAVRLAIYPWQVVGVIRACERLIKNRSDRSWAIAAEGVVVLSIAVTLAVSLASYQNYLGFQKSLTVAKASDNKYELNLLGDNTLLHIRGTLEIGITRQVSELLEANPKVRGVILDSGGGHIYEGRGLARLIRENKLATYSLEECASSCTTAFIAGSKRTLAAAARLGFHQYKYYAVLPVVDVNEEQAKDRAQFAAQGISPTFLAKIFQHPPEKMWLPEIEELITAGVVHEIGFTKPKK